jgi:DAACS family dicarboxylate/amino acid:cation (Na+ or H+) symporter
VQRLTPGGRLGLRPHILLLAGFVVGTGAGVLVELLAPDRLLISRLLDWIVRPIEHAFLSVLFLLIVPLLFSAIISGLSRIRSSAGMPGLLAATLAFMVAVSFSAVLIGMAMANLFRPGDGIPPEIGRQLVSSHLPYVPAGLASLAPSYVSVNGWILVMVILSFAVGATLPLLRKRGGHLLLAGCERLFETGMRILAVATRFAPVAVACFIFDMMVMFGWHLLIYLSAYILVVVAALALQIAVTFSIVVWMRGGLAPAVFLRSVQEAAVIAFCTSSSNATLPTALKVAEVDLSLPGRVVRPVLGLGTVANQGGTAIYVAVTVLFVGQFFGMDLSLDRQALVFVMAALAGMGTMGVPAGALPAVATVMTFTGLPPEGIGLVIGVDRLLDMFRTLVNVTGDLAIAVAITREPVAGPVETNPTTHEMR